ncbi:MAG: hypothetical protein H6811_07030 [Phycisphaeraceae bacterium]|nr:hypothetical protein [Phycisphaeraceae bacterium]
MIARITGTLAGVSEGIAQIRPDGSGVTFEVLVPPYLEVELRTDVGKDVSVTTFLYLESHGQGTSFLPRLLGFRDPVERRFFELLTTVKGLGHRRALRAMAEEPAWIARAILHKDAKSLTRLPEIGKRLAETMLVDLSGKVEPFLGAVEAADLDRASVAESKGLSEAALEAIAALESLGESGAEAERLVRRAIAGAGHDADSSVLVSQAVRLRHERGR